MHPLQLVGCPAPNLSLLFRRGGVPGIQVPQSPACLLIITLFRACLHSNNDDDDGGSGDDDGHDTLDNVMASSI